MYFLKIATFIMFLIIVMFLFVGCCKETDRSHPQPIQVFGDFNNDGNQDILDCIAVSTPGDIMNYCPKYYNMCVSLNLGNNVFGKPAQVLQTPHASEYAYSWLWVIDIKITDFDQDGNQDIVYKTGVGNNSIGQPAYYKTMLAMGFGNGWFSNPSMIQNIKNKE